MRHRIIALTLATVLVLGSPMALVPASAQGQGGGANITALAIPVVGAVTGALAGTFNGTARITSFARSNGQLVAVGTLTGTVTNAAGVVVQSLAANFSVPVTPQVIPSPQAICGILNLVLGPIHLDLLGLVIDTNQIVLNITAVPGAGSLLGNLLCSVAGLLDEGGSLRRLVNLLNDTLAAL